MTKYQALRIKVWRVKQGNSWRRVHESWQEKYVPKSQWKYPNSVYTADAFMEIFGYSRQEKPYGWQIEGRNLCNEAMDVLKEEEGWN